MSTQVREARAYIKVIVMSGQTNADILYGNRPDALLRKPFAPATLLKAIQDVADGRDTATVDH